MKLFRTLFYITIASFFSCDSTGQNQYSNNSVKSNFSKEDTIFYMKEMSEFLDTSFLDRYENEIVKYEKIDSVKGIIEGQILFMGSSSVRRWYSLKKDLFPLPVINRGFGGSTLPEAIYFFNRTAIPYKPAAIVLYEGDNDVMAPFLTPELILQSFKLFERLTEQYLPNTHIYFLSIKPSPSREKYLDKMLITNMIIKEYCSTNKKLNYIDITEPMYDNYGEIRTDIFQKDRLHMNKKGYDIWGKIIKDALLQ